MRFNLLFLSVCLIVLFFTSGAVALAAEQPVFLGTQTIEKAQVVTVANEREIVIPGTDTKTKTQTIRVLVLEGAEKDVTLTVENDYAQLKVGDVFYLRHTHEDGGADLYSVADPYRLNVLWALSVLFFVLVVFVGGFQGVRGVVSLTGSLLLIFYVLLPSILKGYSPILVSISVSSLIIIVGSYITHGFNRTTTAAVFGMIATVVIVGGIGYMAVYGAHLSGYSSEESTYLTFSSRGSIDLIGLVFGGIMIGLLGVLYDIAIGQAVSVEELLRAGKESMNKRMVFLRAMRIGREHIGALVNTLAIAYVGAALPLLLLFRTTDASISYTLNSELFATEIIRILTGSIGLILAVPITTLIAVYFIRAHGTENVVKQTHTH